MTMTNYVAAFRAYAWSSDVALLARRFFDNCPGARHVVLLNEENGPIDIGDFEKIAHGCDFTAFDLPERPVGKSLWFNGDYSYIFLRHALPEYPHYVICESDVAVNLSLEPMMRYVADHEIDAVVHQMRPPEPDWYWIEDGRAQQDPWAAFLFICVYSARALDVMLAERQHLARQFAAGVIERWPIVDSFVPTALRAAGMRFAEFSLFADVTNLQYRPRLSLNDPRAHRPGTLVHPVINQAALVKILLREQPPQDYYRAGSILEQGLAGERLEDIAGGLADAFARDGDHAGLLDLYADIRRQGLDMKSEMELAFCRPATLSSVSLWSRDYNPAIDATGANGVEIHEDFAFHTGHEIDAWWMVDLLDDCLVERVSIANRVHLADRLKGFAIESSTDGARWTTRHLNSDVEPISSDVDRPWTVSFDRPFVARHIRVRRTGPPGHLHLRRVQVFGRPALAATVERVPA